MPIHVSTSLRRIQSCLGRLKHTLNFCFIWACVLALYLDMVCLEVQYCRCCMHSIRKYGRYGHGCMMMILLAANSPLRGLHRTSATLTGMQCALHTGTDFFAHPGSS